ncbi:MAG: hypothetical protein AAFU64_04580, partial [Bacteroidota bacterium]
MISNNSALRKSVMLLFFILGSGSVLAQGIRTNPSTQTVDAQLLELYQQKSLGQNSKSLQSSPLYIIGDEVVIQASALNGSGKDL